MKYRGYILLCCILCLSPPMWSQSTGEWISAEVEFDLPKKFTVEASLEARALNPGRIRPYKYFFQGGLNYKVSKFMDLSLKYRTAWRQEEDLHYYFRNKMMFDLKFDRSVDRFKFNYRSRFQRMVKTYINSEFDPIPARHWRNKLEVSYNVRGNPIEPSVFTEAFVPLNGYGDGPVDEFRIGADVKYPLAKKQTISGGLMYVREKFETDGSGIIFQLAYKIRIG